MSVSQSNENVPPPWQPRYGLGSLMLVMLVLSAMAAAASYFVRALQGQAGFQPAFIIFTLVAPVVLLVLLSTLRRLWDVWRR